MFIPLISRYICVERILTCSEVFVDPSLPSPPLLRLPFRDRNILLARLFLRQCERDADRAQLRLSFLFCVVFAMFMQEEPGKGEEQFFRRIFMNCISKGICVENDRRGRRPRGARRAPPMSVRRKIFNSTDPRSLRLFPRLNRFYSRKS